MEKSKLRELYLEHYGSTLDTVDFKGGYDFIMNQEYTSDGYNVFLCHDGRSAISISEDVYYYSHELTWVLKDAIQGAQSIYCGEEICDELFIDDDWEEWCLEDDLVEYNDKDELVIKDEDSSLSNWRV